MTVSRGGFAAVLWLIASVTAFLTSLATVTLLAHYFLVERPEKSARAQESETMSEIFATPEPPEPPPEAGTFTDGRDGATYKTAKIGGKTWLAENLRYRTDKSWCYDDDTSYCGKYGRLYAWEAAAACPSGWRLPTRLDWLALTDAAGGREAAGKRLKAKAGWDEDGNGSDSRGFSALPGGSRHRDAGDFGYAGAIGFWWTATEYENGGDAYIQTMKYDDDDVGESYGAKGGGMSVRCVRND